MNVSGHRLSTMEIESALVRHPAVAEAAVVGKPHEITGQSVACFVTLKKGEWNHDQLAQELRQWVAHEIGSFAKPEQIRFTDALPKTRSGKIMRRLLREIVTTNAVTRRRDDARRSVGSDAAGGADGRGMRRSRLKSHSQRKCRQSTLLLPYHSVAWITIRTRRSGIVTKKKCAIQRPASSRLNICKPLLTNFEIDAAVHHLDAGLRHKPSTFWTTNGSEILKRMRRGVNQTSSTAASRSIDRFRLSIFTLPRRIDLRPSRRRKLRDVAPQGRPVLGKVFVVHLPPISLIRGQVLWIHALLQLRRIPLNPHPRKGPGEQVAFLVAGGSGGRHEPAACGPSQEVRRCHQRDHNRDFAHATHRAPS